MSTKNILLVLSSLIFFVSCNSQKDRETKPTVTEPDYQVSDIDETWNELRNYRDGFAMKIPQNAVIYDCDYGEVTVPVDVFQAENGLSYIATAEFYNLDPATGECKKFQTSLQNIASSTNTWRMVVTDAENDEAIDRFIKEQYGKGCSMAGKEANWDFYNVQITGTGPDAPEETICFINWATEIKYSSALGKIVKWDLGQDSTFIGADDAFFDLEMNQSFRFIDARESD